MIHSVRVVLIRLLLLSLMTLSGQLLAMDRVTGKMFATRSEVIATHGMAATSQPLATQVCIDILKQGASVKIDVVDVEPV